ncbi:MAG: O-antigen ligase family protein, partial [Thiothrix sp.]
DKKLAGDWRGIMMSKNIAGAVCSVTIIYFLFGPGKLPHWIRWPVVIAAAVFLFFSQSKTSGVMVVGAIIIALLYANFKSRYRGIAIAIVFLLFMAAAVLVTIYANPIRSLANDPTAFTGRMQIWTMLLRYAADSNYMGAGFGAFWSTANSPVYSYATNWVARIHAGHSGYLDLLVTVGAVGVVLVVISVIIAPAFNLLRLPFGAAQDGALPLAVLFFGAGHNATETSMFDRDTIVNVFMLIAVAMIAKLLTSRAKPSRGKSDEMQRPTAREMAHLSSAPWKDMRP